MERWYRTQQADADPGAILGVAEMLAGVDLRPELGRVTCPVLLLHPDSSPFIPVETMAELKSALPDARLQVFARARHGLPFSHAAAVRGRGRGLRRPDFRRAPIDALTGSMRVR